MTDWDLRFLNLASFVAQWSKDPSTKVGAVIVDQLRRVVSVGYNGFPRGVEDDDRLTIREVKYEMIVHGEVNAVLSAGRPVAGCTLYTVPFPPCSRCASMMVQAGIKRVVAPAPTKEQIARWGTSFEIAENVFEEGGVELVLL